MFLVLFFLLFAAYQWIPTPKPRSWILQIWRNATLGVHAQSAAEGDLPARNVSPLGDSKVSCRGFPVWNGLLTKGLSLIVFLRGLCA